MIGLKEVGLDRLICGWQRGWVESVNYRQIPSGEHGVADEV